MSMFSNFIIFQKKIELKMYKYNLYGLNVLSDLPLDCYPYVSGPIDLTIHFTHDLETAEIISREILGNQDPMFFDGLDGRCRFYFCGDDTIVIFFKSELDLSSYIQHVLLGFGISLILARRNIFFLHGSSISIDRRAVVIIGKSGAGKSSLSAGLVQEGAQIIADDMTRVNLVADIPFVYPGYPVRRLYKSTMETLGICAEGGVEIADKKGKFSFSEAQSLREIFLNQETAVDAIVCINPCEASEVGLVREDAKDAIPMIYNNVFNTQYFRQSEYRNFLLSYSLDICEKIPVYRLYRPANAFTVNNQAQLIMSEFFKKETV